jgi:uncharacterized protein (TIGR02466 family)
METDNVVDAFRTPLFSFDIPNSAEFNKTVANAILEEEQQRKTRSESFSLKGKNGWHSDADLTMRPDEWSQTLLNAIFQGSTQFMRVVSGNPNHYELNNNNSRVVCWAMVMREGDYSSVHTHPNSDISGAYYLQIPKDLPDNEGNIVFVDPRGGARGSKLFGSQELRFAPVEGHGWIFPSWIDHYVQSHYTSGTRISISWNLTLF